MTIHLHDHLHILYNLSFKVVIFIGEVIPRLFFTVCLPLQCISILPHVTFSLFPHEHFYFPYRPSSSASLHAINAPPSIEGLTLSRQHADSKRIGLLLCCNLTSFSAQLGIFVLYGFSLHTHFEPLFLPSITNQCGCRTLLQSGCRIDFDPTQSLLGDLLSSLLP